MIWKNFVRDLRRTASRLISVSIITLIAVMVYTALSGILFNLDRISEQYLEGQNTADYWLTGTSLDAGDCRTLAELPGVTGVQQIAREVQAGKLTPDEITEETLSAHMMTAPLAPDADPDVLIRTSGEERISNFLLWQLAYSELVFTDVYWPDYTPDELARNIAAFQQRNRRFGGLDDGKDEK